MKPSLAFPLTNADTKAGTPRAPLYNQLCAAYCPVKGDGSTLLVLDNAAARRILRARNLTPEQMRDEQGMAWFVVPFAFAPFWADPTRPNGRGNTPRT